MSVEHEIQEKIQALMLSINETIPVKWTELYANVEMAKEGGKVYFFFKPKGEEDFHYSVLIPQEFDLSQEDFMEFYNDQVTLATELWNIFLANRLPVWSTTILSYVDGALKMRSDYAPWLTSDFSPEERMTFFKHKYIGYQPASDAERVRLAEMQAFQDEYNSRPL